MTDPALLARTAERLQRVPGFIAFELRRYRELTQVDPADDFYLPQGTLVTLGLCRRPRPDHYAADTKAIADKVGLSPTVIANLLRATETVTALASRTEISDAQASNVVGLVAAARDHGEEHTAFDVQESRDLNLPGWLMSAVERFWGETSEGATFPRDLQLPILTNLPLAIVEIDGLNVQDLDQWLLRRHLPQLTRVADRPLRGCLLAYAGLGLLFVDRSDDAEQRRLTMAHEAAHFILDYLIRREDVAHRRPELLDVLDGERAPTNAERFDSLLADVPIGFHTHLLERDSHGGHLAVVTADVEERAERLALELLAPLQRVADEVAGLDEGDAQRLLRDRFGLPAGAATRYANHVRSRRPSTPRSLMDAIGLSTTERTDAVDDRLGSHETDS